MRRFAWQMVLVSSLIVSSVFFYLVHYAIFGDARHIFLYLIGDLAFLPVQVLFVTLIVDRLLAKREKLGMLKKMNMVIGVFFSEVGTPLLSSLSGFDRGFSRVRRDLVPKAGWGAKEFHAAGERWKGYQPEIASRQGDLGGLRIFFLGKREFLLGLLENPNLLEHESFTDLLWAVFHLAEELSARQDVNRLAEADYEHLAGDIKRAYVLLVSEWLAYMKHLREDYPYLFSLAARTNPIDPEASPEVR